MKQLKSETFCIFISKNLHISKKSSYFAKDFASSATEQDGKNKKIKKTMTDIEQKVRDIIVDKLGVEASKVTRDASFTADLNADSLDTVDIIIEFEKEFGITIPDEDTTKISTVGDAIDYVEKAIA